MKVWFFTVLGAIAITAAIFGALSLLSKVTSPAVEIEYEEWVSIDSGRGEAGGFPECSSFVGVSGSELLAKYQQCSKDEDCALLGHAHCPFGCTTPVNAKVKNLAHDEIHTFLDCREKLSDENCMYRCTSEAMGVVCDAGVCSAVSMGFQLPEEPAPDG